MERKRIKNVLELEPVKRHFPFVPTHGTRSSTITCFLFFISNYYLP